ncbi:MAG: six-hairpin glycosidase-like protein [Bacteroidota bacterium]
MRCSLLCFFVLLLCTCVRAQKMRWETTSSGNGVVWRVGEEIRLPHTDNVEMSGRKVSMVVSYAVDTNRMVKVERRLIYPQLRPCIKMTDPDWWATYRNYLRRNYSDEEVLPKIYLGDKELVLGPVDSIRFTGHLSIFHAPTPEGLRISRHFYPDGKEHRAYEMLVLKNLGSVPLEALIVSRSTKEEYVGEAGNFTTHAEVLANTSTMLAPGGKSYNFIGYGANSLEQSTTDGLFEQAEIAFLIRRNVVAELQSQLVLETPEPIYNAMFSLAKIRGAESIFDSKLGLVHSPGGERYYMGFWANDQAEYINPFFPYLGYDLGNDAALNMWRVYQQAIPDDGSNIRYSFEMQGDSPANPLDRGDAAMIAYGLSHYLLALGDPAVAEELWPLLAWCLAYNHKMLTPDGVVASQSDEMEGRIETGDANLSTSCLYYGALETSISLASTPELQTALNLDNGLVKTWMKRRKALGKAIETFFGREVEGLETYRYYKGHDKLRHWICLPLVVGLHERREGTLTGLFDSLWTDNGVHVEKNHPNPVNSEIFWDRGTLYALRGAFAAGATERAHERLLQFSRERLLGERVPYVVEAYPEGNMAHLSAENGLYCRIFTEGLFGIKPTGFRSFELQPRMPKDWSEMALRKVFAFGQEEGFDLEVNRVGEMLKVKVLDEKGRVVQEGMIREGEWIRIVM